MNNLVARLHKGDDYETPLWAVRNLFVNVLDNRCVTMGYDARVDLIYDPACGRTDGGNIIQVAAERGYDVRMGDIKYGSDFLSGEPLTFNGYNPILVCNPPYSKAYEFVDRALTLGFDKAFFLLRLNFLEGTKRRDKLFNNNKFKGVYVFPSRVTMWPMGQSKPANSGTAAYGWFQFGIEPTNLIHPFIKWLSTEREMNERQI